MTILERILGRERRSATTLAQLLEQARYGGSGLVTGDAALSLIAVYACVRVIADAVASLPLDAFRYVPGGEAGPVPVEVTPTPVLLREPWPTMTRFDWCHRVMTSLLLRGNAVLIIGSRDANLYPTSLYPVPLDQVTVRTTGTGAERREQFVIAGRPYEDNDLVHIPAFTVPGSRLGLSPIELARRSLTIGSYTEDFAASWFADATTPSSVLETDLHLNKQQADEVKARWMEAHGKRHREPAVLSGGLKWRPISITPEESQFLATQKWTVEQVARLFGVPPHMIGDVEKSTSWGTGIEQQGIGFVTYTLRSWITRLEAALTPLLPKPQYARFNVNGLLRGDTMNRFRAYQIARQAGILSVNEIRALEEKPPIEGGDIYLQPANMIDVNAEAEAQATPPSPTMPDEEPADDGELGATEQDSALLAAELRHLEELEALRHEVEGLKAGRHYHIVRDSHGRPTGLEMKTNGVSGG